jgi:hypothetical protein
VDQTECRTTHEPAKSLDDADPGWSWLGAFPIIVAAIIGLLWRGRREPRDCVRPLVPGVPHPHVLKDAHLR